MTGNIDVAQYPEYFFYGAVRLDLSSAIRADINRQHFTVVPRHWYIDAWFICKECHEEFCWGKEVQRFWFEEAGTYVWARPSLCRDCWLKYQERKQLQKRYNVLIGKSLKSDSPVGLKQEMLDTINRLEELSTKSLPEQIMQNRQALMNQLK
ncbi:MAG: zinc-ribbon domain containing protein [Planctomycetaceae bacterium]|nr:zinc-ribbon domain containing protein [Planctomycetaceae bacterium]